MSRIAGIFLKNPRHNDVIAPMLDTMQGAPHWEKKVFKNGRCTFGWTGWKMPQIEEIEDCLVMIDGTIFNRHDFKNGSDCAIIFDLFKKHGFSNAVAKLNGDFAIALYDRRLDELWLARDRFGIKPLYYDYKEGESFAFASRPAALFKSGSSKAVNREFAALFVGTHYRYFDNSQQRAPYEHMQQLPAGYILRSSLEGGNYIRRYWKLEERDDFQKDEKALAEEYRELLLDAVNIRFKNAENPVFTLSGGMDSSSVLACAVYGSGIKQQAISSVYEDKTYDESDEITTILDSTVEKWHPICIGNPDVFSIVQRMIASHDEPVATATWLSHFLLSESASKLGFKTVFGGLGGDELNAGEYEYFFNYFADLRNNGEESILLHEISQWVKYHDHPVFKKNAQVVEDYFDRCIDFEDGEILPESTRLTRYFRTVNPEFYKLRRFKPVMDHPFKSFLKNRTYQDIFRETAPCCLRAQDRQSVAFGLDNHVPFFDYRLAEFMFRVPGSLKIRNGVTKVLLREAMKEILPEETRTRIKKTGWNAPAHQWFSGTGRTQLMDMIHSQSFKNRGLYNVEEIERIAIEHEEIVVSGAARENHMMFLWQLVNMELWLQWLDQQ
ncbi:MAG TPA: asparagine synthase-related protein [Patescibacteria group bacterium]|nr:asparagine synthase-related protein [Patescibacteria group bacterium]